ncbi:adenylosuccinate synthetase [Trinickia acidisoli]|uniref:adenylosuccinate synthetase n=1 Tax=Trinickia acidisoli TaxID=2767482 RepID=UPI001A8BF8CB|nr:adenylosuccinate synthetase [Trinickia acidisoli]
MGERSGYADVLVGLQYGDEGKAKIVDMLADQYDIIARFNGGANAGHTIVTPHGAARLMQVPSGAFHPGKLLYIGSGCTVNIVKLAAEIEALTAQGAQLDGRLFVSHRSAVIQPIHILADRAQGRDIGTTGNGIGPCYAGLAARMRGKERTAVQLRDLLRDEDHAFAMMQANSDSEGFQATRDEASEAIWLEVFASMRAAWERVRHFVSENDLFLTDKVADGARVLFEGAQSVMLDLVHGDQPFVTSSHTGPAYAYVGGDLPCQFHRKSIGIVKAVVSRVGAGPFPAELGGERSERYCTDAASKGIGQSEERQTADVEALLACGDDFATGVALRVLTGEYGTGSGRPRRIGLLDLPQIRRVVALHGIDELFINKCDCLTYFGKTPKGIIPVIVEYRAEAIGLRPVIAEFSAFEPLDRTARPSTTPAVAAITDIPASLEALLQFIERHVGCPIVGVGVGPGRADIVQLTPSPVH